TTPMRGAESLTGWEARSRSSRSVGWRGAARTSARAPRGRRRGHPPRARGRRRGPRAPRRSRTRAGGGRSRPPRPAGRGCLASAGRARSPSPEHHLGIREVGVEVDAREPLERVDVACPRAGDDVVRKLRSRLGLVPAERLAVVAGVLLVERGLRAAGLVLPGGPEARRVGRERLVAENEPSLVVASELELRVRDQDAARGRVLRREAVQLERDALQLLEEVGAHELRRLTAVDVLVVAR